MLFKHYFAFVLLIWNVKYTHANSIEISDTQKQLFNKAVNFYKQQQQDSALTYFIKLQKEFLLANDSANVAKCSNNIAKILLENNDFVGSEQNTINAIKYYGNDIIGKFKSYNRLGIITTKQGLYAESIKNYQKTLSLIKSLKERDKFEIKALTNIGNTYQKMGDYANAVKYYQKALAYDSINIKYPKKYARLIDNKAYSNLLKGNKKPIVLSNLLKSLALREKIKDFSGSVISSIHIANYYKGTNNPQSALSYAKKALLTSKKTSTSDYTLALLTIANIDKKNSANYLKNYIKITDSMLLKEHLFKNSAARVIHETNEKEQENSKLKNKALQQEKKEILLFVALVAVFSILLISTLFYKQRQKIQKKQALIDMFKAKENERNRLAGNVHDTLAGDLKNALTQVDNLNANLKNDALDKIGDVLETAYNKARNISQEYQKLNFEKISFEKYITSLIIEKETLYKIAIQTLNIETIDWNSISTAIKTEIYRILQEALLNISKHAKATNVQITFELNDNLLKTTIKDDGVGMDNSTENVGLTNIRSRVEDLNGEVNVISSLNNGFELTITIPV